MVPSDFTGTIENNGNNTTITTIATITTIQQPLLGTRHRNIFNRYDATGRGIGITYEGK